MQGWLVARDAVGPGRVAPGGHVLETVIYRRFAVAGPALESPLQTGGVGGMVMAGVLLLVLGLVAVAVWKGDFSSVVDPVTGGDGTAGQSPPAQQENEASTTSTASDASEQSTGSDVTELTDKEVIVDILEDHDGRMKQARIVDTTGWSKSKVSMLLSEMEDDGDITKLRVGRENIISLRGNEPDAAGSPFDSQ